MRITSVEGVMATIEVGGVTQRASLLLVPEATVGDYVLVHAGCAITVLDAEEAQERRRLIDQVLQIDERLAAGEELDDYIVDSLLGTLDEAESGNGKDAKDDS